MRSRCTCGEVVGRRRPVPPPFPLLSPSLHPPPTTYCTTTHLDARVLHDGLDGLADLRVESGVGDLAEGLALDHGHTSPHDLARARLPRLIRARDRPRQRLAGERGGVHFDGVALNPLAVSRHALAAAESDHITRNEKGDVEGDWLAIADRVHDLSGLSGWWVMGGPWWAVGGGATGDGQRATGGTRWAARGGRHAMGGKRTAVSCDLSPSSDVWALCSSWKPMQALTRSITKMRKKVSHT